MSSIHFLYNIYALHRRTTHWQNQSRTSCIAENNCTLEKYWDKTRLAQRGPEKSLRLKSQRPLWLVPGFRGEGHSAHLWLTLLMINSFTIHLKRGFNDAAAVWMPVPSTCVFREFPQSHSGRDSWTDLEMIQCDMIRQILLLLDYLPESDYCVNPSPDSCQQQATHIQKKKKGHWVCKYREDDRGRVRDTGKTTSSLTEGLWTVGAL